MGAAVRVLGDFQMALNETESPARRWAVPRLANLSAAQGPRTCGGGNPDAGFEQFNAAVLDRLALPKYVLGGRGQL